LQLPATHDGRPEYLYRLVKILSGGGSLPRRCENVVPLEYAYWRKHQRPEVPQKADDIRSSEARLLKLTIGLPQSGLRHEHFPTGVIADTSYEPQDCM
jgi:hypothetical protein